MSSPNVTLAKCLDQFSQFIESPLFPTLTLFTDQNNESKIYLWVIHHLFRGDVLQSDYFYFII